MASDGSYGYVPLAPSAAGRALGLEPPDEPEIFENGHVRPSAMLSSRSTALTSRPKNVPEIVQFTSSIYFCREDDESALIDVMRVGTGKDRVCVHFTSVDQSARAGVKYKALEGWITFEPGELLKHIEVEILEDSFFDATLEFRLQLDSPENCLVGKSLWSTRILIVDNDMFPSNAFAKVVQSGSEEAMAGVSLWLLIAYMRFAFLRVPTIWWKSISIMLLDQLWTLYYLFTIYLQMYFVDTVLDMDDASSVENLVVPGNRYLSGVAVGIAYVLPNFVLTAVGRLKVGNLEMGKALRTHLQVNLFRKYMNFTPASKHKVPIEDLTTAMDGDIPMMVEDGYLRGFSLMKSMGKILVVSFFMLRKDPRVALPLIFFPVVMFMFIRDRQQKQVELENDVIAAEESSTGMLVDAVNGFQLIRDYMQRSHMAQKYEELLEQSFKANDNMNHFRFWNNQLVPLLTACTVGIYMALGAQQVLLRTMTLGSFLAMIAVLKELGDRFQGMYDDLANWVQAGAPLCSLTRMLNLETDVLERMRRNRSRRTFMKEMLENHYKSQQAGIRDPPGPVSFFDRVPICLDGIQIQYIKALNDVEVQVMPGTMLFIMGGHATGKTTLVRILTDIHIPKAPDKGQAIFSSHNRCLHVSNVPQILPYLNLYENLTFGDDSADPRRVLKIFDRVAGNAGQNWLKDELERNMAENHDTSRESSVEQGTASSERALLRTTSKGHAKKKKDMDWHLRLSFNEEKMVHLTRALVYNPEILVLSKPTADADRADVNMILGLMREFVDQRGVECDADSRDIRRPRTAIFSGGEATDANKAEEMSDIVWHLSGDHGLTVELGGHGQHHHLPPRKTRGPGSARSHNSSARTHDGSARSRGRAG